MIRVLLVGLLASGCSTLSLLRPTVPLDPILDGSVHYARNITFDINGVRGYPGSAIAPKAPKYTIWAHGAGDMDFLLIKTCGRAIPGSRSDKDFKFEFIPNAVELAEAPCPLFFEGVEKGKNRTSWGWIDFKDPKHELQGVLTCNDKEAVVDGVGVCESMAEAVKVRIAFKAPAIVEAQGERCQVFKAVSGSGEQVYQAVMPRGTCTINFMDKATRKTMRLTLYGWDEMQPRNI